MRFYFGFSKRIMLKNLFKIALMLIGGFLAFFGINNISVLALEDGFTNRNIGNIKYCSYDTSSPNATCTASSSTYQNSTINGIANTMIPVGIQTSQNGRMVPTSHTNYWIYGGVSATGSDNPCNNPNTISFNVTLNLEDPNNVLASNELNPNSYSGPTPVITASIRDAIFGFTRKSYSSSNSYYYYTGTGNVYGVKAGFRTGSGTNDFRNETTCSFISYGSNKSLNFRCTINATLPSNSLYIRTSYTNSSYNNPSLYPNLIIRDDIKVSEINDPCNNNYASDSQGIVDSINGQSGQIAQNTQDIIDSQNNINDNITDFKNNNHQDMEDLKDKADGLEDVLGDISDKQDDTNDKLDDINDGINQTNNGLNEIKDGISCIEEDYHFNYGSNSNLITHGYLSSTGRFVENNDYEVSDYLKMGTGENKLTLDFTDTDINYCIYTINKTKISCHNYSSQNIDIEKPQGYYYIRLSLKVDKLVRYKRCNVILGGSGAGHYFGDLYYVQDQPISSLITMPVYLLNKVISSIEHVNDCQPFRVPFNVFNGAGDDIIFPCIDLADYIPATLLDTLDTIFCLVIFYRFSKWIIQLFENLSSADDTFDYMYGGKW